MFSVYKRRSISVSNRHVPQKFINVYIIVYNRRYLGIFYFVIEILKLIKIFLVFQRVGRNWRTFCGCFRDVQALSESWQKMLLTFFTWHCANLCSLKFYNDKYWQTLGAIRNFMLKGECQIFHVWLQNYWHHCVQPTTFDHMRPTSNLSWHFPFRIFLLANFPTWSRNVASFDSGTWKTLQTFPLGQARSGTFPGQKRSCWSQWRMDRSRRLPSPRQLPESSNFKLLLNLQRYQPLAQL